MRYGVLKQKNPEYRPELWRKLDDLYVGGFQILDRAAAYIPKQIDESPERYEERLQHAEYINYLGMVVDSYTANLFAQEPVVTTDRVDGGRGGAAAAHVEEGGLVRLPTGDPLHRLEEAAVGSEQPDRPGPTGDPVVGTMRGGGVGVRGEAGGRRDRHRGDERRDPS